MERKKLFNRRPIAYYAIALLMGIYFALIFEKILILAIVAIVLMTTAVFLRKKRIYVLIIVSFILGMSSFYLNVTSYSANLDNGDYGVIEGTVYDYSIDFDNTSSVVLENVYAKGEKIKGKIKVNIYGDYVPTYGDKLEVLGKYELKNFDITNFADVNDFLNKVNYEMFDVKYKVVGNKINAKNYIKIATMNLYEKYLNDENGGFALSFLMGDKKLLSFEAKDSLKEVGLSHILAISGLHIGFIITLFSFFILRFKVSKKLSNTLIMIFLAMYLVLTAFSPSTIRTVVMFSILLLSERLFKRNDNLSTLCLTIFVICLINPIMFFNLSFVLSTLAMLGIFMFYDPLQKWLKVKNKTMAKYFIAPICLCIAANAFVALISLSLFKTFNLIFILSNLLILPLASICFMLLMPITFLSIIVPPIGYLLSINDVIISVILGISKSLANITMFTIEMEGLSYIFGGVYCTNLVILSPYCIIDYKKKVKAVAILTIILILLLMVGQF